MNLSFKKISLILVLMISLGCSSPKFYSEVHYEHVKSKNDNHSEMASFNPHRLVFKALNDKLNNTEHIIYLFSLNPEWDSKLFTGVIFDVDNNEYYYSENNDKNIRKVRLSNSYSEDNYYKFIIKNYKKGNLDYLKKLGEISGHSGVRVSEVIYEINLATNESKRFTFQDFLFMNGKPTRDVEN